jgi:two-component system response regulator EvgA
VVLVDDHPSFRRAARELFAARGYEVVGEAGCGAGARVLVERLAPDLVVVDVCLGLENGFDVARVLRSARPVVAVLMVSANEELGSPERAAESGACGFVPKVELGATDLDALWMRVETA